MLTEITAGWKTVFNMHEKRIDVKSVSWHSLGCAKKKKWEWDDLEWEEESIYGKGGRWWNSWGKTWNLEQKGYDWWPGSGYVRNHAGQLWNTSGKWERSLTTESQRRWSWGCGWEAGPQYESLGGHGDCGWQLGTEWLESRNVVRLGAGKTSWATAAGIYSTERWGLGLGWNQ